MRIGWPDSGWLMKRRASGFEGRVIVAIGASNFVGESLLSL